ncbi:S66 peptidase family protein [Flavihumibacter profundi]|uniref:S66 peptidase family protein n=1 Tax=Flavihumibacter profundi TaxID=2716883 RepID=UPI001CC7916F|nr:LD-carboxypeptidase [Flavihumibacter profundi]MBZ5858272.1 LD-carboxypeptidase [Flavihumibacter profundi]
MTIPPYLKAGDTIGLVCPAGYMPPEKWQTCVEQLQAWGYKTRLGKTMLSNSGNYFSGPDAERLDDLQQMLDDREVKAILCGRGGYGVSRIIDQLDFRKFKKHPKWIIGFSDITVLHAHINRNFSIASLHAPMANAFNNGEHTNPYVQSLRKALTGKKGKYTAALHEFNQFGIATAPLVGGNLTLVAHLVGTPSAFKTKNRILFLEDVGEFLYNIDRMLLQLKRAGVFDELAGLVIGGFTDNKDTDRPFGKTVHEIIHEHVKNYLYPVCFDFPVSHEKENYALKVGAVYQLKVNAKTVRLDEV